MPSQRHARERDRRSRGILRRRPLRYDLILPSTIGPSFTDALSDVGGGSVKNGTRHSLARIPLRWMIRECFKAHTGIIFDAHMLRNEVGLDINSIDKAPKPLSSTGSRLSEPDSTEIERFSFTSALSSPFRWVWSKVPQIRTPGPPPPPKAQHEWEFEGEAEEELHDALSPIYDQLEKYTHWQVMEKLPCKFSPLAHPHLPR